MRFAAAGLTVVLALLVLAQASPAFAGYDADVWTYLLIAERLAAGADLGAVEPFRLAAPASPQVAPLWHALAATIRAGADGLLAVRVLALASVPLISLAAWRLARRNIDGPAARMAAVAFFWLAMPSEWSALGLGRTLGLALVLMAAVEGGALGGGARRALLLAAWIGGAFWIHAFMGVLAVIAAVLGAVTAGMTKRTAGLLAAAIAAGVLAGAPALATPLALSALPKSTAHATPQDVIAWSGLEMMRPTAIARLWPWPMTALAALGIILPGGSAGARKLALAGCSVIAAVLFTPLFGLAVDVFGAWMTGRLAHVAFVWIGAARGADVLAARARPAPRAAAAVLTVAAAMTATVSAGRDFARDGDRHFRFAADARREAASLRPALQGRGYVSADLIAYGLAAPTLGRPLGVPPGHASPYGDFVREHRQVVRALGANTPECWAALLALHPDVELLVTPAAEAREEQALWASRVGNDPAQVRALFADAGALEPLAAGSFYLVDRIRNPDPSRAATGGMGEGRRCQ